MAEGQALVGLQAQAPDMMVKLGQLLNLRHQKAVVQQTEQDAAQRKNIAAYDWKKHRGADGVIDLGSFDSDPEAPIIFGDRYIEYRNNVAAANQAGLSAKSTLLNLRSDQRDELAKMVGALASDPDVSADNDEGRKKVNQAFIRYQKLHGTAETLPVLEAYGPMLQNTPKGKMADSLETLQLSAFDAAQQAVAQQPQYTSTGRALTDLNPLSRGGGARDIPLSIAPGAQAEQHVDQLGNPYLVFRDPRGNIVGTQAVGGGEGGPARFDVGERDTFEKQANTNFENVTSNRQAASMAPQQLDQINKALDLSKEVSTGAWAAKKAQVESGIGSLIPGFEGFDEATKLQELDKFAERIATDASRVLGVNARTDSERESIHKQNANIGYTPKAIQAVLSYAKAQTLAMEAKGNAQEAWLSSGNKVTKHHEFETEFRKAYDPRIFQFEVMNDEEKEKFAKSLSKEDRKEIAEKTRKLIELGALPGG